MAVAPLSIHAIMLDCVILAKPARVSVSVTGTPTSRKFPKFLAETTITSLSFPVSSFT